MKVVHLASEIGGGGAARSALNLHLGLLRHGINSIMVVGEIHGDTPQGVVQSSAMANTEMEFLVERDLLIWGNRSNLSNTHYSLNLPGSDPLACDLIREADVINLHWVAGSLSASSISALASLGKPMVWTLHDMRPLTGGCHFPAGCQGFEADCRDCPQLLDDLGDLVAKNKNLLLRAVSQKSIHFVAPSTWMLERTVRASTLGSNKVNLIPYGVDSENFTPGNKLQARQSLGLDSKALYILLAAHNNQERRKGFIEAKAILDELKRDKSIASMIANGSLRILLCGHESEEIEVPGYIVDRAGYLNYQTMPLLYRAADILLFTSLEDNMPNVVMEGLACGLPLVGHDLGGVRDLVGEEWADELLFTIGDIEKGCSLIKSLTLDKTKVEAIKEYAVKMMKAFFTIERQADAYLALYHNLINNPTKESVNQVVFRDEEFRVLLKAVSITKNTSPKGSKYFFLGKSNINRSKHQKKWISSQTTIKCLPISVIIPTFNCRAKLERHLEDSKEWLPYVEEIIAIDSKSRDGTKELLEERLKPLGAKIISTDPGLYEAWNLAASSATQPYIYYSTICDIINKQGLIDLTSVMIEKDLDVIISPPSIVSIKGEIIQEIMWPIHYAVKYLNFENGIVLLNEFEKDLMTSCFFPASIIGSSASNIYRSEVIKNNPFPTDVGMIGDVFWALRNFQKMNVGIFNEKLATFCWDGNRSGGLKNSSEILEKYKLESSRLNYGPDSIRYIFDYYNIQNNSESQLEIDNKNQRNYIKELEESLSKRANVIQKLDKENQLTRRKYESLINELNKYYGLTGALNSLLKLIR